MGPSRSAPVSVDLVRVLELLRTHITAALCQSVFATVRVSELQRRWTLQALVEFWLAVILQAPRALAQALYEPLEGSEPLFPFVAATPGGVLPALPEPPAGLLCRSVYPVHRSTPHRHPGALRPGAWGVAGPLCRGGRGGTARGSRPSPTA